MKGWKWEWEWEQNMLMTLMFNMAYIVNETWPGPTLKTALEITSFNVLADNTRLKLSAPRLPLKVVVFNSF